MTTETRLKDEDEDNLHIICSVKVLLFPVAEAYKMQHEVYGKLVLSYSRASIWI